MELVLVSIFGTGCMLIVEVSELTRRARRFRAAMSGSRRAPALVRGDAAALPLDRAA